MTRIVRIALPFVLTFVFGVASTAIVRSFLPNHRKAFFDDNGWSRCKRKAAANLGPGNFESRNKGYTVVEVTEVHQTGRTTHSSIRLDLPKSYEDRWTLKERVLLTEVGLSGSGLDTDFGMRYVSPEAIDGKHVTSNAVISYLPRPRYWGDKQVRGRTLDCNAVVRVDLDSSGSVSRVTNVPGHADSCPYISDIVQAASEISFRPALRDGVPVSQRMSIMYRSH